jgi:hypothetical protein
LPFLSVGPEPAIIKATGIFVDILGIVKVPKMSPVVVCKMTEVSTKTESLFDAAITVMLINKENNEVKIDLVMLKCC